jgi:hypothetical protein
MYDTKWQRSKKMFALVGRCVYSNDNMKSNPCGLNGTLSIRLKELTQEKLASLAKQNDLSIADIARLAIEAAVKKMDAQGGVLFSLDDTPSPSAVVHGQSPSPSNVRQLNRRRA